MTKYIIMCSHPRRWGLLGIIGLVSENKKDTALFGGVFLVCYPEKEESIIVVLVFLVIPCVVGTAGTVVIVAWVSGVAIVHTSIMETVAAQVV
jgi:hypothetical protein